MQIEEIIWSESIVDVDDDTKHSIEDKLRVVAAPIEGHCKGRPITVVITYPPFDPLNEELVGRFSCACGAVMRDEFRGKRDGSEAHALRGR